jgi:hypothetical protein
MTRMGLVSRSIDKLPRWAQVILMILGMIAGVYSIAQYGFWSTILHAIFSPVL